MILGQTNQHVIAAASIVVRFQFHLEGTAVSTELSERARFRYEYECGYIRALLTITTYQ